MNPSDVVNQPQEAAASEPQATVAPAAVEPLKAPEAPAKSVGKVAQPAATKVVKKAVKKVATKVAGPATQVSVKPMAKTAAKTAAKAPVKVPTPASRKVAKKVTVKPSAAWPAPATEAAKPQKPGKTTKVEKPVKVDKPAKAAKPAKAKIVRDSFTMPEADFALIDQIKQRALGWKQPAKKSEVLRAALQALQALPDAKVRKLLAELTPIKKGRPKNPS